MLVISQRQRHPCWRMLLAIVILSGLIRYCEPMSVKRFTDSSSSSLSTLSRSSSESRSQNLGSPSDLAWQAWLLLDSQTGAHSSLDSASFLKRITPKSVFIAPVLPACPDGYRADTMGRCVKRVNINPQAHIGFLLQRLNNRYGNQASNSDTSSNNNQKKSSGPLQLNIPLFAETDTKSTQVDHEETRDSMNIPIVVPSKKEVRVEKVEEKVEEEIEEELDEEEDEEIEEVKEVEEAKDVKEAKEVEKPKEPEKLNEMEIPEEVEEPKEVKEPKEIEKPRKAEEPKEMEEVKDVEVKDVEEAKDVEEMSNVEEANNVKEAKDVEETKDMEEPKELLNIGEETEEEEEDNEASATTGNTTIFDESLEYEEDDQNTTSTLDTAVPVIDFIDDTNDTNFSDVIDYKIPIELPTSFNVSDAKAMNASDNQELWSEESRVSNSTEMSPILILLSSTTTVPPNSIAPKIELELANSTSRTVQL
ncbi:probable serine/threonine-protein kinase kinX isoform X2 [Frieseomelitta varia]|uniref:probable serine/threonine-protein kinase kinX isoform X2 n=1 Tax=Frieseomelitta varia TaxID=561572 RepID=UPI001CB69D4C|nr:probable serine/threonine-protein kinase kinX isoform X2 [Frieseomelitta varia]